MATSTDHVVCWWRVDGFLYVSAVEVVIWSSGHRWETEQVPLIWAVICQVVYVEAGIFIVCRVVDLIEDITAGLLPAGSGGDFARWRELRGPLVEEISVSTAICASCDVCNEALVQVDHIVEVIQRRHNRCCNC